MSDLKPPSQNRPGPAPSSRRMAIRRSLEAVPQFKKFRQECVIGPADGQMPAGEWVRFVTDTSNPIATTRNARTLANLIATERVDLVHAVGIGASRSAAALKKRAGIWLVHTYDTRDLNRPHRDRSYSRALGAGDRVILPSQYVA